ncbi:Gluconate 5-dehydrogenase [uncultured Roseburia sp.]|uniref:Glucose 1-dehydrogenase n=1 Tax=Brotonthovivens ammoniilytica TaxID=2981725 RepID=A0ABT2TLL1_9FIRM|nr:glucose 1-dehydrogenase [Brotonthovivens ammoniilytica]MCU6762972.1 glucose 1-dehydrogenase [Brotonthovivens ammoniilytica]SCI95387.1 Gluconate 5-dehydrogenase [uncultured Roseburia sp.]
MFNLKGKVAVVTGASSGLGADAARAYAKAGASVAILARRKEKLEALAEELKSDHTNVLAVSCDVTDEASVKSAVQQVIEHFGKIDILLNNAGIAVKGGVDTLSQDDWNRSMDTNVKGIFLVSKYVVPHMMEQHYGKIINTSSVNAFIGDKADLFIRHSYNASKSAVLGLSMGMAASYGKYNITVNTICPGLFESEMTSSTLFQSEEFLKAYSYQCPLGRPGQPGELNGAILFFSSDASSYITGQFMIIDGGTSFV